MDRLLHFCIFRHLWVPDLVDNARDVKMKAVARAIAVVGAVAVAACSGGSDTGVKKFGECSQASPACGPGKYCDYAQEKCTQRTDTTDCNLVTCGPNTRCAGISCACAEGFSDCNGDLGQPDVSDGCECDKTCNGTTCGGAGEGECDPFKKNDCGGSDRWCDIADNHLQDLSGGQGQLLRDARLRLHRHLRGRQL